MDKGHRFLLYNIIVVKTLLELPCNFACNRFVSYYFHFHFHFCGSCFYLAFDRLFTCLNYAAGIDITYCDDVGNYLRGYLFGITVWFFTYRCALSSVVESTVL